MLFDLEAVFPSLSHGAIFMLLRRMSLPPRLLAVTQMTRGIAEIKLRSGTCLAPRAVGCGHP